MGKRTYVFLFSLNVLILNTSSYALTQLRPVTSATQSANSGSDQTNDNNEVSSQNAATNLAAQVAAGASPTSGTSEAGVETEAFLKLPQADYDSKIIDQKYKVGDIVRIPLLNLPETAREIVEAPDPEIPNDGTEKDPIERPYLRIDVSSEMAESAAKQKQGTEVVAKNALTLALSPTRPGKHTIPAYAVKDNEGNLIARTLPFTIDVQSVLPEGTDPKQTKPEDIVGPTRLPFPLLLFVISLLVLGLITALLIFLYKKYKPKKVDRPIFESLPRRPFLPEDEEALSMLDALQQKGLIQSGKHKEHYFQTSEIIKHYVGRRFGIIAEESTTSELMERCDSAFEMSSRRENMLHLKGLFSNLDLVKFTDYVPNPSESTTLMTDAKAFVNMTRKVTVTIGGDQK